MLLNTRLFSDEYTTEEVHLSIRSTLDGTVSIHAAVRTIGGHYRIVARTPEATSDQDALLDGLIDLTFALLYGTEKDCRTAAALLAAEKVEPWESRY